MTFQKLLPLVFAALLFGFFMIPVIVSVMWRGFSNPGSRSDESRRR